MGQYGPTPSRSRARSSPLRPIRFTLRALFWLLVLLAPLASVWLGGSLAATWNGPHWLPFVAGALLFPVLPVAWELWASRRRSRRRSSSFLDDLEASRRSKPVLRLSDRLLLRTLALNVPFLIGWIGFVPGRALTAVATRGAWMLDGVEAPWAEQGRAAFGLVGDRLQRYNRAFDNEWEAEAETDTDREPEPASVEPVAAEPPPPPPVVLTVVLPEGVIAQARALLLEESTTLELRPGEEWPVSATFPDLRKLSCTLRAADAPEAALEERDGAWLLGGAPCTELRAPDPSWRPEIRLESQRIGRWLGEEISRRSIEPVEAEARFRAEGLLAPEEILRQAVDGSWVVLGPPVVAPAQVSAVHLATPYFRLELDEDGKTALCEATTDRAGQRFGVLVEGELRFVHLINEARCDGFLPLETGARQVQHDWTSTPEADAAALRVAWPLPGGPHPLAGILQAESIDELGRLIAQDTHSQQEAARLVHDWVATHVRYDVGSLRPGKRQPQDADTVFRSGSGVCAGYANLIVALSRAAGLEAVYIVGNVRADDGGLSGTSHAWNGVKVDGHWILVDATWDAGTVDEGVFEAAYRNDYLFTPPELFRYDHLPKLDSWQLAAEPLSRGDFIRQAMLTLRFASEGLELLSPKASVVDAHHHVDVQLRNPRGRQVSAKIGDLRCSVEGKGELSVRCPVPTDGHHELKLFVGVKGARRLDYAAGWVINGV